VYVFIYICMYRYIHLEAKSTVDSVVHSKENV